ncbi:MAG: trigger factor, partial [Bacteroidota bacterium]
MEITRNQLSDLHFELSISLAKEDYVPAYENALKQYRKRVQMPGFRPGHAPMTLVKRQYGAAILGEEVDRKVNDLIYRYIVDNKIAPLGNPLPLESSNEGFDINNPGDMNLKFEIGLTPSFNVADLIKDVPAMLKVEAQDDMVQGNVLEIMRDHGSSSPAETCEEGDMVGMLFQQVDNEGNLVEGGINTDGTIFLDDIDNPEIRQKFIGAKADDTVMVNPLHMMKDHLQMAHVLGISHEELHHFEGNLKITIVQIARNVKHELNQELFDKVLGEGVATDEASFRAKIKEQVQEMLDRDSRALYRRIFITKFVENLNIPLPEEFLKRWIMATNEKPITEEQVEQEFEGYSRFLKFDIVMNQVAREHGIVISDEDIRNQSRAEVRSAYARYGMDLPEHMLEMFVDQHVK